jgi:hypothetical protein
MCLNIYWLMFVKCILWYIVSRYSRRLHITYLIEKGGRTARHSEHAASQVFRKFHTLVELERFMTVLTQACHCTPS